MSFALLFAGQGTLHAAMLPWLEAEPACQTTLEAMQACVGPGWRDALADADWRSSNGFAQPLITGTSLAAWAAVRQHLRAQTLHSGADMPRVVAGYSVGELAAFACAGALDVAATLSLAVQRAALMDAAVAGVDTGLLSVSAMEVQTVLACHAQLDCAIHLAADHAIYAAESRVLDACSVQLAARGAICRRLEVRVASHSRWMAQAALQFAQTLQQQGWATPACPVVLDASASATRQPQLLMRGLAQQLCSTVHWSACMDAIAETGVRCVMEIGAGSALSALWNARHGDIPARSVEEFRDAAGAARWIARHLES